jgi:dTDP-4-amino-4,6-dideoxygalactose transaminase
MDYKILLFDLNFDQAEQDAVIETLRSKWISTGPKNAELERRFAEMTEQDMPLHSPNCTVALHMGMVLMITNRGRSHMPSLTFVATVNASGT